MSGTDLLNGTSPNSMTISSVMTELKDKFKNEDDERHSPFQNLDKATVLQETKIFSDANMVTKHPKKCCQLITKLLHILTQGEPFTSTEATEVFFGVTKLFQSKDANLRRMMYLFIKEVAEATAADEVIIVTQSLTKDMSSDVDLYKANAIRVLCRIIDGSMLTAIERYIKQAIVDRNSLVASSALVSGIHLIKSNPDVIRRWVSEVQEAVNSQYDMVQYHAISLLYQIRQHDKLAVSKLIIQLQKMNLRSNLGACLLIRYTANLLKDDLVGPNARPLYQFLEKMLRHKNEMVAYEAARSICSLPLDAKDLTPAISVLQMLLTSSKPASRFAAVRTLNQVAMIQPMIITKCNDDMENLISDPNRSIATLAITTLLKTGAESSVDRLMKQISNFMGEIADEFKIVVVDAIKNLCIKYPQKHRVLLNFLANFLREEGGFDFKKTITDSILFLIERIPESKESGLLHLCEFIEDCEFTSLSTKVLYVLGEKGPSTAAPSRYIRFIYNRIILENATVRAAAVSSLAQFAVKVESLTPSIINLLKRCKYDDDDEVRDRATVYLDLLETQFQTIKKLLVEDLPVNIRSLKLSLEQYQLRPTEGPITFESLPHVEYVEEKNAASRSEIEEDLDEPESPQPAQIEPQDVAKELYKIPEFSDLGPLFRSSKQIELTEAETEYVVHLVKHVFKEHIVLQYQVLNTVDDQLLTNVSVDFQMEPEDAWKVHSIVPLDRLPYNETGSCYVCIEHIGEEMDYPIVQVVNELKFKLHEVNPSTGQEEDEGFDEEYRMEDFELSASDLMARVRVQDFRAAWEHIGDQAEAREQYALQFKNLSEAVSTVIEDLGLQPFENTANPQPKAKAHILLLSGVFAGGVKVLAKCKLSLDEQQGGIVLQMAVRSENEDVSQLVTDCIR